MLFFRFLKDNDIYKSYINTIKSKSDSQFLYGQKYFKANGLIKYLYRMYCSYDFFAPFFACSYNAALVWDLEAKWQKLIQNIYNRK